MITKQSPLSDWLPALITSRASVKHSSDDIDLSIALRNGI